MNKKIFFAATVAAAALTACTSEEALESVANKPVVEAGEVVGAKLAGTGISVVADNGEADTRAGWSSTDKIGLAWIDNGTGDITSDQGTALAGSGYGTKLYANTILTTADGGKTFTSNSNVYEGAYFVYTPWQYVKMASQMVINPNAATQTADVATERYANLPWISGLKFIAADKNIEKGQVSTKFTISPVANTIIVRTTPDSKVSAALGDYSITMMDIYNPTTWSFPGELTLDPNMLPEDGCTTAEMDDVVKNMTYTTTFSKSLKTNIAAEYGKISKGNNEFRAFTMPVMDGYGLQYVQVYFHVTSADAEIGKIGEFKVDKSSVGNAADIQKLDEGLCLPSAWRAVTLTQILRGENGNPAAGYAIKLALNAADFDLTLANDVKNLKRWNAVVDAWEKLGKAGQLEVTVTGEVEFDGDIKVPANGVKVKVAGGSLSLKEGAKATLPEKLVGDDTAYPEFTVKKNAELTVSKDTQLPTDFMVFKTEADGKIILSSIKSKINVQGNNAGTIEIKQGAASKTEAATVLNPSGKIVYMIDEADLNDEGQIYNVEANASITEVVLAGKKVTTTQNLPVVNVTAAGSQIETKGVNTASIVIAEGADLKVTVKENGTLNIGGNVDGKGKLTVAGSGKVTGTSTVVASTITLVVEAGVTNAL